MGKLPGSKTDTWLTWPQLVGEIDRELTDAPEEFLRQYWISRTMHPSSRPLSELYAKALSDSPYWQTTLYPAARDPDFGRPFRYEADPTISTQSLQHTYYLNILYERCGLRMPDAGHIVELGGGYGNMARIVRALGHRGRYQIADLPAVHRLQRHYLDTVAPGHGVEFISTDEIEGGDLLIATFSLSEMTLRERDELERRYPRFRRMLFATTQYFRALGVDNLDYFTKLADRLGGKLWKDPHRSAWFLLCER